MRRMKRAMQQVAAIAVIAAFLGTAPAVAADRPGRAAVAQAGPLAQARLWLGMLAAWGSLIPASGWSSSSGDEGLIIDPDGFRVHRQEPSARSEIQAIDDGESRTPRSGR